MNARFLVPDANMPGAIVPLPADEVEHTRVLRLTVGHPLRVFNGAGGEFDAVVEEVEKSGVRVRLLAARTPVREPRVAITLAQAVLKGDKMDDVVRDAAMLGVAAIQPVITARTEISRAAVTRGRRRARWERIAISSVKQCGRATVPAVFDAIEFEDLAAALSEMRLPLPGLMFVEPGAATGAAAASDLDLSPQRGATVIIGPEGGWTAGEIDRGAAVARHVTLGPRTLRADAMPVVALSALFTVWREF